MTNSRSTPDLRSAFSETAILRRMATIFMCEAAEDIREGNTDAVIRFADDHSLDDLALMSLEQRYALIRKMGPCDSAADDRYRDARDRAAAKILLSIPFPQEYEAFEAKWIEALVSPELEETLRTMRHENLVVSIPDALALIENFSALQARAFNQAAGVTWGYAPEHVGTFAMGRDDVQRLYPEKRAAALPQAKCFYNKPNREARRTTPALDFSSARSIALNTHPDAGPLYAGDVALIGIHEQAHMLYYKGFDLENRGRIGPSSNPFSPCRPMMEQENALYDFIERYFGWAPYRCLMTERVAFSFEKKFRSRLLSRRPHPEHDILVADIMSANATWLAHMGCKTRHGLSLR